MPIKIPSGLPARDILDSERIFALEKPEAEQQRVRPLRLVILNLMPKKIETETQLLRLISKSPLHDHYATRAGCEVTTMWSSLAIHRFFYTLRHAYTLSDTPIHAMCAPSQHPAHSRTTPKRRLRRNAVRRLPRKGCGKLAHSRRMIA
jgi:hypothetical protein